ncbi:hypothetical protein DQ04_01281020 [Trypanosoma grayi]|uniref:hypothetical protein n=1 Tax=Trypanosoma grayi TaxID=71804 RepID=UPI0004F458EF|nr:hypothetical protein DQ04_01281020 [Trypanosoma grayi]KEG12987.1 hypothetical protein DQ04_01281020 [Trypanosoma grayi]
MYHRAGNQTWTPPPNFAMVEAGIYRSAYPTLAAVPYLKHIGIKTVVLLSIELLPGPVAQALSSTSPTVRTAASTDAPRAWKEDAHAAPPIRVVYIADLTEWMNEYSWSRDDFAVSDVQHALDFALQTDFQPVLFACPTGEMQTSVVVGCMRRYQGWTVAAALAECQLFVNVSKRVRSSVMSFIERWDLGERPVRETDIASRKRELLLRERQHEHYQRRRRKGATHTTTDTDSENEDAMSRDSAAKAGRRGIPESTSAHREDSATGKRSVHTVKISEDGVSGSASPAPVLLAPWYIATLARREALADAIRAARAKVRGPRDPLPEPHVRYFGVRNPPALDERSTFTKESVVEEDDD